MRFIGKNVAATRYKTLFGFSQILLIFIAMVFLIIGIFDTFNPDVLNLGKNSLYVIFIGALLIGVTIVSPMAHLLNVGRKKAWFGAFTFVLLLMIIVTIFAVSYNGGIVFG